MSMNFSFLKQENIGHKNKSFKKRDGAYIINKFKKGSHYLLTRKYTEKILFILGFF